MPAVQRLLLPVSLAALFGAGLWTGMALGERRAASLPPIHDAARLSAAASAGQWAEEAAASLTQSLGLTPAHAALARKHLAGVSEELFRDRDRAQFQIHLRLLKVHDLIGNDLVAGTSQAVKLKASREKLRLHILERFQRYLSEHPEAGPLLSSSL